MNKNVIVGVDIGGTTVKIGFISLNGDFNQKWEVDTDTSNGGANILKNIWDSIVEKAASFSIEISEIAGIGIGAPGFIDGEKGYVFDAVNIGWKEYPLAAELSKLSGLPVYLENDANIAVLGENWLGAGENADNVIAITLGTGVGGGIITNGKIVNGVNGTAGEIGHITVEPDGYQCNCGRKGCLETIASATGIARQAMKIIEKKPASKLAEIYNVTQKITSKDIFELAKSGDADSKQIIEHTADIIGLTIANLAMTLNPSKILIGGGVSKAGEQLLQPIKNAFTKYALPRVSEACEIRIAELGNDAGMIGAAYLVKSHL
ncbi:ROK family glucokinase [Ornithinibacillus bavariensis]|uniref:Glucokinase n=1 Tax=Ornithinibacillus bavariensis TaxID=545502 RepID=A0A919X9V1_9BACI|nr:ROK family glucokinase [Ornithinibacillus bavariensis]GIO27518.1 glucokinase [Ornithinibacillus bavariensis]HAM80213.1 glucokinase [Ornithinibacillus sp.]